MNMTHIVGTSYDDATVRSSLVSALCSLVVEVSIYIYTAFFVSFNYRIIYYKYNYPFEDPV